ncbi:MAG TPA: S41 family peptidase [Solirubrobacteraceae bacterium]|nr:S41 family peptidase [Solirubrobacteraceae bacterium]
MYTRRQRSPRFVRVLLGIVVLLIGVWFGGHPSWLPGPIRSAFVSKSGDDKLINQVLGLIQTDYYRKVSRSDLVDKGLEAAVASLNDKYSHYYDPSDYRSFQDQDNPHLSGIGIDIKVQPQGLLVQDVFQGSPAEKAGLARGDIIVEVGSTSLANRTADFSASLIKGRAGTKVTLTVLRGNRRRIITVRRADLVVPVAANRMLDYKGTKLGYVELTSFTAGSGAQVRSQVQQVLHQGARGLILDLRENGGGLLNEAVNVASVFIPDGTIVSTDGRAQPRQVYLAKPNLTVAPKIPMVVLVDDGTASSAEIVTGALQDRGRAKVVGTHTYGKGVFQEIEPLSNGGALDFTVGEYFTPSGRNLGGGGVTQGKGIQPNVYAFTKSTAKTDTALTTAERTVAAETGQ